MFNYILTSYNKEDMNKSACYYFDSEHDDLELDPYQDNVPFAVGSNQSIYKVEDAPYLPEDCPENRLMSVI